MTRNKTTQRPRRWLCSHLVELTLSAAPAPNQPAVLEEIESRGAALAVESSYPPGTLLSIGALEQHLPGRVLSCVERQTDFLIEVAFADGYRWDPAAWKPDHLYLPPVPGRTANQEPRGPR